MEQIKIYIEEAVNGYRLDVFGYHQTVRENTDDRLSTLRALERVVQDMLIEELEHLVEARKQTAVTFSVDEAANG